MTPGDWFRVRSFPGQIFQMTHTHNGDVVAYGGAKDPKGQRQYQSFRPDTIFIPANAPFIKRKERDED